MDNPLFFVPFRPDSGAVAARESGYEPLFIGRIEAA
jgi:hypothetical protein